MLLGGYSCKSKKNIEKPASVAPSTTPTGETRKKLQNDECEDKANEAAQFLRAYGVGRDADRMLARNLAAMQARAELVQQVQATVATMLNQNDVQMRSSDKRESTGKAVSFIQQLAEESLKGNKIICSNTYEVGGQYEVHVCIELTGQDFIQKSYNKLANEEKLIIDYNYDKYKKDFDKALDEYRKRKE